MVSGHDSVGQLEGAVTEGRNHTVNQRQAIGAWANSAIP